MKYKVIDKETNISVQIFSTKKEAVKKAEAMTDYHGSLYIVVEVN